MSRDGGEVRADDKDEKGELRRTTAAGAGCGRGQLLTWMRVRV